MRRAQRPAVAPGRRRASAAVLAGLFAVLLAVSVAWPVAAAGATSFSATGTAPPASAVVPAANVFALGVAAFLGRLLSSGAARPAPMGLVLALNTLAAVAEEAFFRRLIYGTLLRGGAAVAVVGSALAFAAVHVTVYGPWVLPLDLAAGLVLGWQR